MNNREIKSAIQRVSRTLKKKPRDSMYYRERAQLFILAHEYHLARSDLDATYHYDGLTPTTKPGRLHSDHEINGIGATYWMEGHLDLAVSHWRYAVEMHLLNRVRYSDSGVGIHAGLLLWFGAANRKSPGDTARVEQHFRKRAASKYAGPRMAGRSGAPVRYFLREINDDQLLAEAGGSERSSRQYRCTAQFAMAVRAREEGRHKDYYRLMKEAAGPKDANPYDFYNMWEFYLAVHAVVNSSPAVL